MLAAILTDAQWQLLVSAVLAVLLAGLEYLRRKMAEVHVLVNSRLTEALTSLEALRLHILNDPNSAPLSQGDEAAVQRAIGPIGALQPTGVTLPAPPAASTTDQPLGP